MPDRFLMLRAAITLLVIHGCGSSTAQPSVEESIAKAVQVDDHQKKDAAIIEGKARAERQHRASDKQAQEQARAAEVDAVAVQPAAMPADLAAACSAVVDAYDGFIKRGAEKDVLAWHEGRRRKLAERRAACVTQGNLTVAACQSQALAAELPLLAELERTEAARVVMTRCADKFGAS
jgi:hypothetical protein